jgi:hypothetical protein
MQVLVKAGALMTVNEINVDFRPSSSAYRRPRSHMSICRPSEEKLQLTIISDIPLCPHRARQV